MSERVVCITLYASQLTKKKKKKKGNTHMKLVWIVHGRLPSFKPYFSGGNPYNAVVASLEPFYFVSCESKLRGLGEFSTEIRLKRRSIGSPSTQRLGLVHS
jgi:hypothetical protein